MKTTSKTKLAKLMNIDEHISFNIDEDDAERLISSTFMIQTAQTFDGIFYRVTNSHGDIVVFYRNYLDDNVDAVDRHFVEVEMKLNFNHYPAQQFRVERTLH